MQYKCRLCDSIFPRSMLVGLHGGDFSGKFECKDEIQCKMIIDLKSSGHYNPNISVMEQVTLRNNKRRLEGLNPKFMEQEKQLFEKYGFYSTELSNPCTYGYYGGLTLTNNQNPLLNPNGLGSTKFYAYDNTYYKLPNNGNIYDIVPATLCETEKIKNSQLE